MKLLLMSLLFVNPSFAGSKITMYYDHAEPIDDGRLINRYTRCFYRESSLYGGSLTTSIIVEGGSSLYNSCPRTIYVDPVGGTWSESP